jgi:hypothetical protein
MKALFDYYSYKILTVQEFSPFFRENRNHVFTDDLDINDEDFYSELDLEKMKDLAQNLGKPYYLYIGLYYKNEQIGWSFGWQENRQKFYMCNTGILKAHQNKGIYKKLLPEILNILQEKGFQEVYSRHKATNNKVIVPKLQAGFYITKMEISISFGILAHLSYFFNEKNRKALQFWTGQYRPNEDFKKYINGL